VRNSIYLCLSLLLASPVLAQRDIGPPPGRLVDVGGYRLHLHCVGDGSPTIVLAPGASAFSIDWALVQPAVARTNRACSYDRADMGWSDSTGQVATPARAIADLHRLLAAAGEKPPYVLVGASLAGIHVRLYHLRYPGDVAGVILIDPAHEDRMFTMLNGQPVAIASLTAEQLVSTLPSHAVRVPRRQPQRGPPFDKLPGGLYETRVALDERLIASIPTLVPPEIVRESAEGERAALAALRQASAATSKPLASLPLVVLTRGVESSQELRDVHASIARLSTNSRHAVVPGAGHEIHLYDPATVIDAIGQVIEAVRTKRPLAAR
jgi:pimeloyl-ACP methyl ester carboxylesterase